MLQKVTLNILNSFLLKSFTPVLLMAPTGERLFEEICNKI